MWTWSWAIRNIIAEFLMPPGIFLVLIFLAILLFRKRTTLKNTIIILSALGIWISSTVAFADWFTQWSNSWMKWPTPVVVENLTPTSQRTNMQTDAHTDAHPDQNSSPQAIVILGGGLRRGAMDKPSYGSNDISKEAMERLRLGAELAKKTKLPILATGGAPDATSLSSISEGEIMRKVLETELGVKVKWVEDKSRTTAENASETRRLLDKENINKIYVVTHFWHMPRSKSILEKYGFTVTAISCGYYHDMKFDWRYLTPVDFMPSSSGIERVRHIWHELVGMVWYQMSQK